MATIEWDPDGNLVEDTDKPKKGPEEQKEPLTYDDIRRVPSLQIVPLSEPKKPIPGIGFEIPPDESDCPVDSGFDAPAGRC